MMINYLDHFQIVNHLGFGRKKDLEIVRKDLVGSLIIEVIEMVVVGNTSTHMDLLIGESLFVGYDLHREANLNWQQDFAMSE